MTFSGHIFADSEQFLVSFKSHGQLTLICSEILMGDFSENNGRFADFFVSKERFWIMVPK